MSKKNRCWLIICIILFLPWIIRVPRNLQKQFSKLDLSVTWVMTPTERKIHFLEVQMEELDNDYFTLLQAADQYRAGKRISFKVNMPTNLTEAEKIDMMIYRGFARKFPSYWLSPSRPAKRGSKADIEFYYHCQPPPGSGIIIASTDSPQPSYLVEAAP